MPARNRNLHILYTSISTRGVTGSTMSKARMVPVLLIFVLATLASAQWVEQRSGTTARFRGVSAASDKIVWASGSGGTYALTTDGGETWRASILAGAAKLDFRDVEAIDANTAYLLSIG